MRRQAAAPGRRVVSVRVLQCGGAWCAEGEREEAAAVWWRVVRGEGAEASHDRAMTTTGAHSAPGDWASCVVGAGAAPSHRRCVCVCPLDTRGEGARGVVARGAKAEGRGRRRNMAAATGGGRSAVCGPVRRTCARVRFFLRPSRYVHGQGERPRSGRAPNRLFPQANTPTQLDIQPLKHTATLPKRSPSHISA